MGALPNVLPINAGKVLTSFKLLPVILNNDEQQIFSVTLEANDLTAGGSGTVSGTVTGTPMGGSAGPIARAMVSIDPMHGAYTDASGNFTLTNVPTGARTLTVLPYGTGITTKTFPITVAAGTNNAGTLNVGASQTQITAILGATNAENGLHQVEGNITPYGYTIGDSPTTAVTIGGKSARETLNNGTYLYFQVDNGWLYKGMQGANGLTVANAGTSSQTITKLAPDIYITIQYFDRGTDTWRIQYNTEEKNSAGGFDSTRMTNAYNNGPNGIGTGGQSYVTKTGTNTWKTFTYHLDPAVAGTAFGAYDGQNLFADFRISGRGDGLSEDIHSVVISTTPNIAPIPSAGDALRIAGGLAASPTPATDPNFTALDVNGDGKITILDAVKLAKTGNPELNPVPAARKGGGNPFPDRGPTTRRAGWAGGLKTNGRTCRVAGVTRFCTPSDRT